MVVSARGGSYEISGLRLPIGAQISISCSGKRQLRAAVIAFDNELTLAAPLTEVVDPPHPGAMVVGIGRGMLPRAD